MSRTLILGALLVWGVGCTKPTPKFMVGDCLAAERNVRYGFPIQFYDLVVEKSGGEYFTCQGDREISYWYGCKALIYPEIYVKVKCPKHITKLSPIEPYSFTQNGQIIRSKE